MNPPNISVIIFTPFDGVDQAVNQSACKTIAD